MNNSKDLPVSYRYRAPAKINWDLFVFPRNSSGLHPIDSIATIIDLWDELTIKVAKGHGIDVGCPISPGKDNIVWKAVKVFLDYTQLRFQVSVDITKNIPSGAGLGGGSSDAMHTLLMLDRITKSNLTIREMLSIAKQIGSDLPLFLYGGWIRVSGTGEFVERVIAPEKKLLLVKPDKSVSTKEVYQQWDEYQKSIEMPDIKERLIHPFNALQTATCNLVPDLKSIIIYLEGLSYTRNVSMTGSGTAVFAEINNTNSVELDCIEKECNCRCWVTNTTSS